MEEAKLTARLHFTAGTGNTAFLRKPKGRVAFDGAEIPLRESPCFLTARRQKEKCKCAFSRRQSSVLFGYDPIMRKQPFKAAANQKLQAQQTT